MNGLHHLVAQGKVLYLVRWRPHGSELLTVLNGRRIQGISDAPAWIVSKVNMYARMANKTPFAVYQGAWNVLQRDFERDIIPMARQEGRRRPNPTCA